MTPFGRYLATLRINHRVKQKDLAIAMGVNPSYISAIESGKKGRPAADSIKVIVKTLGLKRAEESMLRDYATQSIRTFHVPDDLPEEEYAVIRDFKNSLGSLTRGQISLIRSILAMECYEKGELES